MKCGLIVFLIASFKRREGNARGGNTIMEVEELPRANVKRIVKEKLAQLGKEGSDDLNVQKEALLAFSESARIFIHYLSAT